MLDSVFCPSLAINALGPAADRPSIVWLGTVPAAVGPSASGSIDALPIIKKSLFKPKGKKMVSTHLTPLLLVTRGLIVRALKLKEEREEDPIKEVIRLVVQTLLCKEGFQVCFDMLEYLKNLSQRLLERLPALEGQPVDVGRFYASFKAGWQEWKKKGPQHEESFFEVFLDALSVELDLPVRQKKKRMDKEPERFFYLMIMVFFVCLFF